MKTDRAVVVTGAAGGMGTVFVRRFLDNGDTVIATDTSADSLAKLADSMNSDRLHIRAADITDEADTRALAGLARQTTGRVDVLVNVAGDDLTGAVFFLASPDADFITGQTIIVDGGNEML